ncbi:MAG: acetolactate synthase [Polyangiaceae bacterium]|jgi:acetolactate synthase-1/3 small subunit|nr:acetolactate synthase [Polyangiaceae bacterium]
MSTPQTHTFVAYVEDQPGVLNRVTSLFRRRGYNIVSLNVGRTNQEGVSRMTMVVEANDDSAVRIEANLYKMVNVISVEDITHKQNVSRDMVLIKVKATPDKRSDIFKLCEVFRAHFIDVHPDTLIVEVTGTQDKIDGLVTMLAPFGILEMVQTGTIAMTRGGRGEAAEAVVNPGPNLKPIAAA